MVAGIVFTLGLLNHSVEVFLHPQHPQLGVTDLLRVFHSGPVHSYQDLPKAGMGFDTIIYADWYPVGTPRAGGESKLQGGSLLASISVTQKMASGLPMFSVAP